MTEIEQAREHLRLCQVALAENRCHGRQTAWSDRLVLSALSWVWDAQQRAEGESFEEYETWIKTPSGNMYRVMETVLAR